ncbi:helix-turn-helix domain-containing protein [Ligilactobacillus equi]|uniref:Prophage Lp1 protein 8 n=1 Tax=Ligilactobacillus equi DPC 6820 TaxID=1392007 RepID=V7HU97_9LACO|nr:helix-turn-helix transcriptional regulator [Ligilactobacillus equi]ETA73472.1 prophage Lp1 protein 8 [Ligilactobacillus equi DPC 6820]
MGLADKIKELCIEKRITVAELERKTGISNGQIRKWNERSPKAENLSKVADYFHVTTDYLLGRDGKEENSTDTKDLQKFLEVNRKGMSFGDDPITDEQKEKLDIALKMIFEKYKDKR